MPTINDGEYLSRTIQDIYKFYPIVKTCTIVPVGLTKHRKGLKEIPIVFTDRTIGESKMNKSIIFEAIFIVPKLFLKKLIKKIKN